MLRYLALVVVVLGCGHDPNAASDAGTDGRRDETTDGPPPCTGTAIECAAEWEQNAADHFDTVLGDATALGAFLKAMPKGGDLHNHLTGAVYAETYLDWGRTDGDCVGSTTHSAVAHSQCSATNLAIPTSGTFFDAIVGAWSMQGFVAGSETGHDHFFATFGKYGLVAGAHRDQTLGDVATRAASENEYYVETMFNLAKNTGTLASSVSSGTVTAADLPALYTAITTNSGFANAISSDAATIASARTSYRTALGCNDLSPPDACDVDVRFIAQVSRTGAAAQIFGQLVGAFEVAKQTDQLVAANLSSPEDDSASIANYNLHMAMLDFLHQQYATTSPLHVTLHAGELSAPYLPSGSTANTFHIRAAVETGHAERIGHGIDLESETDPTGLLAEMAANHVLVEVCLSSNAQILEVSGTAHPLATYLAAGVPVALSTDDQGVSRSSIAGEYTRAALDQHLEYRQLKTLARNSLEHAFLPGASLWTTPFTPVDACAPTATMALGDPASTTCAAYLATSARASAQWALEHRFLAFERLQ
ncbi:MAG: adenosine deaminase [Deltaproteobacteria bacterium]